MSEYNANDPMLDMFIFESSQLLEQLEQLILDNEKSCCFSECTINEIFRIMHTIKGSSSMMLFNNISTLSHSIEDLFFYFREKKLVNMDCSTICDLVLEAVDFIKVEIYKIKNKDVTDGNPSELIDRIHNLLAILKQDSSGIQTEDNHKLKENNDKEDTTDRSKSMDKKNKYRAVIYFEEGCEMENIRAFTIIHNLKYITDDFSYIPEDIIDNDKSVDAIRQKGFTINLKSDYTYEQMYDYFMKTVFLKDLELTQLDSKTEVELHSDNKEVVAVNNSDKPAGQQQNENEEKGSTDKDSQFSSAQQTIISVNVSKLDKLMDIMGEMVIAEDMVIQNPDLRGLDLDNFRKAATQLNKITNELQDIVMSIRMVPLSATFHKMNRIVRDMCKKLGKEVNLKILGEETEVDKNIIEHISDPLMHVVRNSLDHGIEAIEDRQARGKSKAGTLTLEAKNSGSDVLIIIKDDGRGLDREKILKKARENGLIMKPENEITDKEVFNLIFLPGFSTNDNVSEFSGRGVGMDVVSKNVETIGGSVSVESITGKGTITTIKIPLTLAIIDGMNIKVGKSRYTLPIISIKESFRPKEADIITDTDGNEMIMVRGQCYPILRLHEIFKVKTDITSFFKGIVIMIEQDEKTVCIFADELLGQQQVVVKALPEYIRRFERTRGLAGCTLLGDGSISLILDIAGLISL